MPRILLIEDDDQVRLMLRIILESAGYEVEEAGNGTEGFDRIAERTPDLVVTDIIMPQMEGLETIAELRRDHPWVRIIAISGGGRLRSGDYLNLAERLGADRIFAKPVDRKDLLQAVADLLKQEDSRIH